MLHALRVTASALLLVVFVTGCATKETKNRIAMLEQSNRDLGEQLNRTQLEFTRAQTGIDELTREREQLLQQLARTSRTAETRRPQLVATQTPAPAPTALPDRAPRIVPAGWTTVPGGVMITIAGGELFTAGKAIVRSGAHKTLDTIADTLGGALADKTILVFGHTDNSPIKKSGWKDNRQLSGERALAVVRYLQGRGIDPSRLSSCGWGEYRPRRPNSSQADMAFNRRIEIVAVDPIVDAG